jgi:hypothetical protein
LGKCIESKKSAKNSKPNFKILHIVSIKRK